MGCCFSQVCFECNSNDTQQAALRRQQAAAGALARGEHQRRIVVSFTGDMKGLMQIAGNAGAGGSYNCLFCLHRNNRTSVAGLPALRHPPEPWASSAAVKLLVEALVEDPFVDLPPTHTFHSVRDPSNHSVVNQSLIICFHQG